MERTLYCTVSTKILPVGLGYTKTAKN